MRLLIVALISVGAASVVELLASRGSAHEYGIGAITIAYPTVTPPARGRTTTAGYMTLANSGATPDRLIAASSAASSAVEIHETRAGAGGMVEMRRREGGVVIPARGEAVFAPGRLHLMIIGLSHGLREGDPFPLTLTFEQAGTIEILAMVQRPHGRAPEGHMH